jgi:hypothetical protein
MSDQREKQEELALIQAVESLSSVEAFKTFKKHISAQREAAIGALIDDKVISNTNVHYTVTGYIKAYDELLWMLDHKKLIDNLNLITK